MLAIALTAALMTAAQVHAVPISGGIRFGGAIAPTNFSTTNSIDVVGNQATVLCNPIQPCTGAFAAFNLPVLQIATYNDFTFNPLGGTVSPLWAFGGFSFNLTNVTNITRGANGIVLEGFGTLLGPVGFDATLALWSFSADETNAIFGFSSTTSASAPVPEPGSLALLGAGLVVLSTAVRRKLFRK